MAQVTVRVGGYSHPVACQDGQERHLTNMAAEVDKRIGALKAMGMQFGETRMLLLAALQLADEASDLQSENDSLKAGGAVAAPRPAAPVPDFALAERLNRLAEAIEGIAAALEGA
ncbi:cell division protein ZapA [Roseomonas eburnea]|uniref:Cell division protein ZapA n=1 Tax=Neoroseomonas eburnea TaxID=1346889 RepID=A0A9X9XIZ5_9PROT|nr:cell division protein ZapA [Neoroseomonas eburnea]MBR0683681.1 cell division protein ZapA [Neoroseomonas eburnea]